MSFLQEVEPMIDVVKCFSFTETKLQRFDCGIFTWCCLHLPHNQFSQESTTQWPTAKKPLLWLGFNTSNNSVQLKFLERVGASTYQWLRRDDVDTVHLSNM